MPPLIGLDHGRFIVVATLTPLLLYKVTLICGDAPARLCKPILIVEPFDKDGIAGYFFKKEDLNYVCFERDACSFSVYGSLDMDELIKIAAGIAKE